ncbi:Protein disulfide-isomerase 2-3 [Balamuthia mandrillaris]
MMKNLTFLAAVVAVAVLVGCLQLVAALPYGKNSGVIELTPQNFVSTVVNSPKYTLVEFYAPWCGHCKALSPEYEKVAKNLQGMIQVAAVNCDVESNRPLAGKYGIQGFPTLKLFKSGSDTPVEDYQGPRTAAAIVSWLTAKLNEKGIQRVVSSNVEEFLEKGKDTSASVLLFTNKPKRTNLFKALANNFAGRLQFGDVQNTEAELVTRFSVEKFPTLMVITKEGEQVPYQGELQYSDIEKFLQGYAAPFSGSASSSSKKGSSNPPPAAETKPKVEPDTEGLQVVTQKDWEVKCLSQRALCGLAFLPSEDREKYVSLVEQLAADRRSNGAVVFLWIDGEKESKFRNDFGVSDNLPGLVLLSPHKKRAADFKGAFEATNINEFVDKVLRGAKTTFPLDPIPSLAA